MKRKHNNWLVLQGCADAGCNSQPQAGVNAGDPGIVNGGNNEKGSNTILVPVNPEHNNNNNDKGTWLLLGPMN